MSVRCKKFIFHPGQPDDIEVECERSEWVKMRVICLSKALEPCAAVRFLKDLPRNTQCQFVLSGRTARGRKGRRIPMYYVVRRPLNGEQPIEAHEMTVEQSALLDAIPSGSGDRPEGG